MTEQNLKILRIKKLKYMEKETHTWQEPGAWRKPCIVHVTMVAKDRQNLFGALKYSDNKAIVEKTPLGWVLVNQQKKMLT